jgi:hypothetical protein
MTENNHENPQPHQVTLVGIGRYMVRVSYYTV